MLRCPRCHRPLAQTRGNFGVLYECAECQGKAISLPVLRRTIVPKVIQQVWGKALAGEGNLDLGCPNCADPMVEVALTEEIIGFDRLQLDVCRKCHFLWFDADELEQIPLKPPSPPTLDERLPPEAKELLALKKIEDIRDRADEEFPAESWHWLPAILGFPVEQAGRLRYSKPWITWTIAGLCILVAMLTWKDPGEAAHEFGLIPSDPWRFGGASWFTSFFFHAGLLHLVGNLYFLLSFGDNVEAVLGRWKYLFLLFASTLVGDLLHCRFSLGQQSVPLIGASGGISGVIVFYALMFPKARLGFVVLFSFWLRWLVIPAWVALIIWVLLQAYGVIAQVAGFSNVSALAHLGGAAVGFTFWILYRLEVAHLNRQAKQSIG